MSTRNLQQLFALCVAAGLAGCGGGGSPAPAPPPPATATPAGCVAGTETLSVVSGDGQTAPPGALLPERPTVRATCESFANRRTTIPMAGAAVQWQVWSGRSRIDGATTVPKQLDADGTTSVAWTLPNGFGAPAVRVTLVAPNPPLAVEFNATVAASTTTAQSCQDDGGTPHGASTVIAADAAWTAAGSPHRGGTMLLDNAVLSIEAGAVVCVAAIDQLTNSGTVLAEGTEQAPIRFFGTALRVAHVLTHVRAENVPTVGSTRPAVYIADSTFRWSEPRNPLLCAQIVVGSGDSGAGATLRRTRIERYGSADCAALRVIEPQNSWDYDGQVFDAVRIVDSVGDAVSVLQTYNPADSLVLTDCQVSGSERHGVVVEAATISAVTITGCNLFGNKGDAVVNQATVSVSARGNWWGDAAGPGGPNGERVSGLVDVADPLAAPATLGDSGGYWDY